MAPSPSLEVELPGPPRSVGRRSPRGPGDGPLPRTLHHWHRARLPWAHQACPSRSRASSARAWSGSGPSRPGPIPGLVGPGHSLGEAG